MKKTNLIADKIYSSFWWKIELDSNNPRNYNRNVQTLTGYSKFQGHDEAKDKIQMLMRKIIMLATNGYLDCSTDIIIYKRMGELIDKKRDIELVTLFRKDYNMPIENIGKNPELVEFLKKLYSHIRDGIKVDNILPRPRAQFNKDEYFEITRHNFSTHAHMYSWAEKMIKDGHSFLQVQNFIVKYLEKKPFNNDKIQIN